MQQSGMADKPSTTNLPRITVVTPTYNGAEFLEQTMQSILCQQYPNLQYIVIDGGSTDNSVEIIRKYEKHLAWWVSEKDAGHYDAVNKGLSRSTGEIMAWLNSDDMYLPFALKTVGAAMAANPQVRWVSTLRPLILDCDGYCNYVQNIAGFSRDAFMEGRYLPFGPLCDVSIQQESTFWRRSLWEQAGGKLYEDYSLAGDFDLWARFYEHDDLYGLDSPLAGFRVRAGQRSSERQQYLAQGERSLAQARERTHWHSNKVRGVAMKVRLFEIPKVRGLLRTRWGYPAKRLTRQDIKVPNSPWIVQDYRFP